MHFQTQATARFNILRNLDKQAILKTTNNKKYSKNERESDDNHSFNQSDAGGGISNGCWSNKNLMKIEDVVKLNSVESTAMDCHQWWHC